MRFKIDKKELEKALTIITEEQNETMPILMSVIITVENNKTVRFTLSNSENNLETMVDCTVIPEDLEDGAVVVDFRKLLNIVKVLPDVELEIFTEGDKFIMQYTVKIFYFMQI